MLSRFSSLSLCAATLICAPVAALSEPTDVVIGQHAPDHGLEDFAAMGDPASGRVVKESRSSDAHDEVLMSADLDDLRGRVVLLHALDWEDSEALVQTLPLLRDLLYSNAHRGIAVISIVAAEPGEQAQAMAESHDVSWPVALVHGELSTPYFSPETLGTNYIHLIGRSGQVLWKGGAISGRDELLEALQSELIKHAAPVLDRGLHEELGKAQELYYSGEWMKARKLAEKLVRKHGDDDSEPSKAIAADAKHLLARIAEHEHDLSLRARDAMSRRSAFQFYEVQYAVDAGFARSDLQERVRETAKEAPKGLTGHSFPTTEDWFEFRDEQPVLFPARKSRAGERFAKKLKKYTKSTVNNVPATQLAQRLLDEYAMAN